MSNTKLNVTAPSLAEFIKDYSSTLNVKSVDNFNSNSFKTSFRLKEQNCNSNWVISV